MTHAISNAGLALLKAYEGFRAAPAQLPNGNWVVGYGHVRIGEPGERLTKTEAAHLLALDAAPFENLVNACVGTPLTQAQFDALVSFAFSLGAEAFLSSQVVRRVNAGDFLAAGYAMEAWRKSDVGGELEIVASLVRRRAAEKALLLKDLSGETAPSAFMRPKLDHAASVLGAPIDYAPAPVIGVVASEPNPIEPTARLTEILKSEPATEALLLTQIVVDDGEAEDGEITTAHARPVARVLDGAHAVARAAAPTETPVWRGAFKFEFARGAENLGLIALLLFGVCLIAVAAAMLVGGRLDLIDVVAAAAVAAPGLAASLLAAIGLSRAPIPVDA